MSACKQCGAPAVEYQHSGKTRSRYRCETCWNAYMLAYRQTEARKAGVPLGWKVIRGHWLKPPPGVTRVLIDPHRRKVTVYVANRWRTTFFATLKRMGSAATLREFYISQGYRVTRADRYAIVLERDGANRFIHEQRARLRRTA